ncbi:hypothetical protein PR202_ga13305 [Eleusine coracana subsp. coracana]|uniref:Uncharacterized protein n=1 Tax=Eleusine coracana subsp. coracana TaxID=191504 RepID=A0AAV5CEJ0_ELECO|nr:hypothetical protein PR202_ga13305 [Eleusine coracana subsp. coracana]
MGASESLLSKLPPQQSRPQWADEITTVSEGRRDDTDADPLLRRIQSLTIAPPLLSGQSESEAESSLTDILVRKPSDSSSAASGNLNPNVLAELFSMYREWQEENAKKISQKQEEIENKIETADALAVKLLKRYNYSVSSMRSTSHNLAKESLQKDQKVFDHQFSLSRLVEWNQKPVVQLSQNKSPELVLICLTADSIEAMGRKFNTMLPGSS